MTSRGVFNECVKSHFEATSIGVVAHSTINIGVQLTPAQFSIEIANCWLLSLKSMPPKGLVDVTMRFKPSTAAKHPANAFPVMDLHMMIMEHIGKTYGNSVQLARSALTSSSIAAKLPQSLFDS